MSDLFPRPAECGCRACLEGKTDEQGYPVLMYTFVVCSICGNKRCPKATDHRHACTNSNAPGQPGSVYGESIESGKEGV